MYSKITEELIDISQHLVESLKFLSDVSAKQKLISEHLRTTSKITNFNLGDFDSGLEWINVSEPLSLHKHLRGKVVILDFFTYCCINCIHVLPDLKALEDEFSVEGGLVIVGVHSAKFTNERETSNIKSAVERYGVSHPVVNDVECSLWNQLGVTCWPTLYILGPHCEPLLVLLGEGHGKMLQQFLRVVLHRLDGDAMLSHHVLPQIDSEHHVHPTLLRYPGKVAAIHTQIGTRLAVADSGHHRILVLDNTGVIQQIVGDGVAGLKDGFLAEARFRSPQGLAFRSPHVLYVADMENHAIREYLFAFGDCDGSGRDAKLQHPLGVAWSESSRMLYVADSYNNKVKLVDPISRRAETLLGGAANAIQRQLNEPGGLCVINNRLYIADTNNHRIVILDLQTDFVSTLEVRLGRTEDKSDNCDSVEQHDAYLNMQGGNLSICAKVMLPTDLKLTSDAPSAWHLGLPDGFECQVDKASTKDFSLSQEWLVQVPSESSRTNASKIDVQCSVFYCSNNVCSAKKFAGRLNLMYSEEAPISATSNLSFYVNGS